MLFRSISSNVLRRDGEFIHTRCFTRDVTALMNEMEHKSDLLLKLEQSEAGLRMAIESTQLGTWNHDLITGALYWSKECRDIYGFPEDGKISFEAFTDHIYIEDKVTVQQLIQRSLNSPEDANYEVQFRINRFNDGLLRWVKAKGSTYFDEAGTALSFIGTILDITETRLGIEKGAKLAAIIESTDDVIISKTLEGIITSWNKSAERTFEYTQEEMIGQSILKLIPEDRQEEEPRILSRLRKGERVEHFETKRLSKSGRLIDVSLTISPIKDDQGNIIGLSKIARDITEKKQEEQRRNSFVDIVSHELKTPLTSMKAYLQILLAKAQKDGDAFNIQALSRTDIQAKKMISMIHDFLTVSRLEESKMQINKTIFELHALIEEVSADAQLFSAIHSIQLKDCKDIEIHADRDKIGQVLINLLNNAIKYAPNGGTIIIGCEKQEGAVKIYVSDEGIGIKDIDQKMLFERFYRVKDERIKNITGFGIGLFLVSEILRYHDSSIHVESQEGVGSTFFFSLDVYKS